MEDYPDQNQKFMEENNIQLFQFGVAGNKVRVVGRWLTRMQTRYLMVCQSSRNRLWIFLKTLSAQRCQYC